MKKAIVLIVLVSLFVPSFAYANYGLGPNAECVYNCFGTAAIITAWTLVLTNCFGLVGSGSLSNSFADGTREAAGSLNLGPNAWCVYQNWVQTLYWYNFWTCVLTQCFSDGE
jgi:hypothetical protein